MGWWDATELADGVCRYWRLGPVEIWVRHAQGDWFVTSQSLGALTDTQVAVGLEDGPAVPEDAVWDRTVGVAGDTMQWTPLLADRAVVVRPETPLRLLPGARSTFYVGSTLWLQLQAGTPPADLTELPVGRPSDTWFGRSTREGELCYATRTAARRRLGDLPSRPGRVVTPMTVHNAVRDPLLLERVKVPVPLLALYQASDGRLWSSAIEVMRDGDGTAVDVTVVSGPPDEVPDARQVAEPRVAVAGVLKRALHGLIR